MSELRELSLGLGLQYDLVPGLGRKTYPGCLGLGCDYLSFMGQIAQGHQEGVGADFHPGKIAPIWGSSCTVAVCSEATHVLTWNWNITAGGMINV